MIPVWSPFALAVAAFLYALFRKPRRDGDRARLHRRVLARLTFPRARVRRGGEPLSEAELRAWKTVRRGWRDKGKTAELGFAERQIEAELREGEAP